MKSYLLIIGDREALGWILSAKQMAFPSMNRREVQQLTEGDELFIYTTRSAFGNVRDDRGRIIGVAHVRGSVLPLAEPKVFSERIFPVGCKIDLEPLTPFGAGLELKPLTTELDTFEGLGKAWAVRLRRPLLELTNKDAAFLRRRLQQIEKDPEATTKYSRWYTGESAQKSDGRTKKF